jgi:hypothetical protein
MRRHELRESCGVRLLNFIVLRALPEFVDIDLQEVRATSMPAVMSSSFVNPQPMRMLWLDRTVGQWTSGHSRPSIGRVAILFAGAARAFFERLDESSLVLCLLQ